MLLAKPRGLKLGFLKASFFLFVLPVLAQTSSRNVVISQIYGGGGNSGSRLSNDFVELFNRGATEVDITNWSIQYAAASGSSWMVTGLIGSIGAGQYYLVQEAPGATASAQLPPADASGSTNLSAMSGKVALVDNLAPLSGSAPTDANIMNLVGYGKVDFSEGSAAQELNNTTAAVRRDGGCADTGNNSSDFATSSPNPRNTGSPRNACVMTITPTISAVTNAASFLAGPVSPGELVTLFGSNIGPVEPAGITLSTDGSHVTDLLSDTRVLFGGIAAPLIYVSAIQITAVVPYGVDGQATTSLQVEFAGQLSHQITLQVSRTELGIFSANQSGQGQSAVLNQDLSANTPLNPAVAGTFVSIYGTGGGQTKPAGEDGKITGSILDLLNALVEVEIGGSQAAVSYAGAAPGLISGLFQVNARVPDNVATGDANPLLLRAGDSSAQPGITVAVHNPNPDLVCGEACGEERWPIKNLTDADAGKVNLTPTATTVQYLVSQPPPSHLPEDQRIAPIELQVFQVTARLVGFEREADMDFHVVIADPTNSRVTMIVEIPSPECADACRSGHSPEFSAARTAMTQRFGAASTAFQQLPSSLVSITGVGFFDFVHGQTGVAANGIELHPVLRIQFLD